LIKTLAEKQIFQGLAPHFLNLYTQNQSYILVDDYLGVFQVVIEIGPGGTKI